MPKWRSDGKELFYVAADRTLMGAQAKIGSAFEAEVAKPLFDSRMKIAGIMSLFRPRQYDVTADGQRFLVVQPTQNFDSELFRVLLNWRAGK